MKSILPFLLIVLLISFTSTTKATVITITQQGLTFEPNSTTVTVGDTIRWVWTDGVHTTTSATIPAGAATWDSPLTSAVPVFEYIVTVEGTYNYVCTPHASSGMTGSFTAAASLGVSNNALRSGVRVYPNPAKDYAVMFINSEKSSNAVLSVYDLLGNRLISNDVFVKQGANNLQMPIVEIQPGIYLVELKIENQSAIVRRFIKSK